MKSKHKILLYCTLFLLLWIMFFFLLLYADTNQGGNGGAAWYAFLEYAQAGFFVLTPIMLMAIALGLLKEDKKEKPEFDFMDTRPIDNQPPPRYERPAPQPAPQPRPRPQQRAQPRTQYRAQPRPQPRAQPGPQQRAQPRQQPRPQPRPKPKPQGLYEDVPEYSPSIFEDEVQCPACKKWISTDMPSCAFCKTKVANFNRVRQVQAQYNQGNITRDQYNHTMKNLKG